MLKDEFLGASAPFVDWLAGVIDGGRRIEFAHGRGIYVTLQDARRDYAWPASRTAIETPKGPRILQRWAPLAANTAVLDELSEGLRTALYQDVPDEDEVFAWMRAIMVWGGVYTRVANGQGNAGWLEGMRGRLVPYLKATLETLAGTQDDGEHGTLPALRSNAGTTKIHALVLQDFIIYDSRVAAALSWLILQWAGEPALVPVHLRFACMRAKTSRIGGKARSPHVATFPYFAASGDLRNHHRHAMWNLRASWLLRQSLDVAMRRAEAPGGFTSTRDLEAALFVMGDDLTHAL